MINWPRTLTEYERSAILDDQIQRFTADGWRVVARTPATSQLTRQKSFNVGCALLGLLFLIVGLLAYLLIYLGKRDALVWLEVDTAGKTTCTFKGAGSIPTLTGDWRCLMCRYINSQQHTACRRCGSAR